MKTHYISLLKLTQINVENPKNRWKCCYFFQNKHTPKLHNRIKKIINKNNVAKDQNLCTQELFKKGWVPEPREECARGTFRAEWQDAFSLMEGDERGFTAVEVGRNAEWKKLARSRNDALTSFVKSHLLYSSVASHPRSGVGKWRELGEHYLITQSSWKTFISNDR